jgi:hypothetical protein
MCCTPGCRVLLDHVFDMVHALHILGSSKTKLPKQEMVACQKEALWRIGQVLEEALPYWQDSAHMGWHPGVSYRGRSVGVCGCYKQAQDVWANLSYHLSHMAKGYAGPMVA